MGVGATKPATADGDVQVCSLLMLDEGLLTRLLLCPLFPGHYKADLLNVVMIPHQLVCFQRFHFCTRITEDEQKQIFLDV